MPVHYKYKPTGTEAGLQIVTTSTSFLSIEISPAKTGGSCLEEKNTFRKRLELKIVNEKKTCELFLLSQNTEGLGSCLHATGSIWLTRELHEGKMAHKVKLNDIINLEVKESTTVHQYN